MNSQSHNETEALEISPDPAQLYLYHRQQLSAMLDGELAPDEARFMLRRLQHDVELAHCWERWQVYGDVLRGRADDLLPADFSQRVMRAIQIPERAAQTAAGTTTRRAPDRWRWRGGAALAASLALVAWVAVREPVPALESSADAALVAAAELPASPGTAAPHMSVPAESGASRVADAPALQQSPALPAQAAAQTAIAGTPSPRPARPPAATTPAASPPQAVTVLAAADTPAPSMPSAADGLLAPARAAPLIPVRPWPRPLLPGAGMGAPQVVVGYGGDTAAAPMQAMPPLGAFQPRWPEPSHSPQWRTPPPGVPDNTPANR